MLILSREYSLRRAVCLGVRDIYPQNAESPILVLEVSAILKRSW